MTRAGLVLALLGLGCGLPALRTQWAPAEVLKRAPLDPDAPAEVLLQEDSVFMDLNGNSGLTTQRRHVVTRVQSERGRALASRRIAWFKDSKLVDFRARVVQPSGEVEELSRWLIISDTSAAGERDLNARFFHFPRVGAGSVIEFDYVLEHPNLWDEDEQEVDEDLPVHQSEFSLSASHEFVLAAAEYNRDEPIRSRTDDEGRKHLECSLRDIPRMPVEDFRPDGTQVQPRWGYRVTGLSWGRYHNRWLDSWEKVVERRVRRSYGEGALFEGFSAKLDVAGCADVTCKVARALAFARSKTRPSGRWDRERPLAQVLESGQASIAERGLLIRQLLADVGVSARLALTTDLAGRQWTQTFPNSRQFDHLLVVVPMQPGLAVTQFLDPDCEFCAPGELTRRHQGAHALVFAPGTGIINAPVATATWVVAEGPPAPTSTHRTVHRVTVDAKGDGADHVEVEAGGLAALRLAEEKRDDLSSDVVRARRRALREAVPQAELGELRWGACEPGRGHCGYGFDAQLPRLAVTEGTRLYVPLVLLPRRFDDALSRSPRTLPIRFGGDDEVYEDVLEVTVPPGYRLVAPPAARRAQQPELRASFEVTALPAGARVTRRLERPLGLHPKERAGDLRAVFRAYASARQTLLVFERSAELATGASAP